MTIWERTDTARYKNQADTSKSAAFAERHGHSGTSKPFYHVAFGLSLSICETNAQSTVMCSLEAVDDLVTFPSISRLGDRSS